MSDEERAANKSKDRAVTSLGIVFAVVGLVMLLTLPAPGVGIAFIVLGLVFFASGAARTFQNRKTGS